MPNKEIIEFLKAEAGPMIADIIDEKMAKAEEQRKKSRPAPFPFVRESRQFKNSPLAERDPADMTADERSQTAGRCARYILAAKGNPMMAIELAKVNGDKSIVEAWEKAMTTDVFASGGALIPPEFTSGIIELLFSKNLIRKSGVSVWPMNTGSLTAPYISSASSSAYVGAEGDNIAKSELGTGQLQFHDKKLAALVPFSNDLLRNGGAAADRVMRDTIVRELGNKEDLTFLRSDGTSGEPKGLLYWSTDAGTNFAANATFNAANTAADLATALQTLEDNNVPLEGAWWAIAPRTKWALASLLDGNSNYIYRDEITDPVRPTLLGLPVGVSSQIPTTGGGGSDESEILLYNAPLCVIAENETLMMEMFDNAAYHDGSAVQSGVSRDESVVRAIALHDFGCQQRGQEVVAITAVKWTA